MTKRPAAPGEPPAGATAQAAYRVEATVDGEVASVYRFDLGALAPIAAEVGPTVAEIHGV